MKGAQTHFPFTLSFSGPPFTSSAPPLSQPLKWGSCHLSKLLGDVASTAQQRGGGGRLATATPHLTLLNAIKVISHLSHQLSALASASARRTDRLAESKSHILASAPASWRASSSKQQVGAGARRARSFDSAAHAPDSGKASVWDYPRSVQLTRWRPKRLYSCSQHPISISGPKRERCSPK